MKKKFQQKAIPDLSKFSGPYGDPFTIDPFPMPPPGFSKSFTSQFFGKFLTPAEINKKKSSSSATETQKSSMENSNHKMGLPGDYLNLSDFVPPLPLNEPAFKPGFSALFKKTGKEAIKNIINLSKKNNMSFYNQKK